MNFYDYEREANDIDEYNQQCLKGEKLLEDDVAQRSTETNETPDKDSVDNASTTPADTCFINKANSEVLDDN